MNDPGTNRDPGTRSDQSDQSGQPGEAGQSGQPDQSDQSRQPEEADLLDPGWAYVSIVSTIPGLRLSVRQALLLQFVLFEGAAIGIALRYGLLDALPFATTAITVATLGSGLMTQLHDDIQTLDPPEPYRRLLFDSSVDVVMGLVAFVAVLTYLFVEGWGGTSGLLERYLGDPPPAAAVFLAFLLGWDLCYRVGTGWLASITGLWRSFAYGRKFDRETARAYVRTDRLTMVFAGLQVLLVPFLWSERLLAVLVVGHVSAVFVVSTLAIVVQRRR